MKMSYRSWYLSLALLAALGIGFTGGYATYRTTSHDGNSERSTRELGVRRIFDGNGYLTGFILCFDKDGNGRFDNITALISNEPPISRPYNGECDTSDQTH